MQLNIVSKSMIRINDLDIFPSGEFNVRLLKVTKLAWKLYCFSVCDSSRIPINCSRDHYFIALDSGLLWSSFELHFAVLGIVPFSFGHVSLIGDRFGIDIICNKNEFRNRNVIYEIIKNFSV